MNNNITNSSTNLKKRSYQIRQRNRSATVDNGLIKNNITNMNNNILSSLQIINRPSKNYGERPKGTDGTIDCIVLHYTATDTIDETLKILTDPNREVSSHYVIDEDGTIYRLVDDDKRAWHAGESSLNGRKNVNNYSIGIELQNKGYYNEKWTPFDERQINALIKLLDVLKKKYNIPLNRIVGHEDVALPLGRKIDPRKAFPWEKICTPSLSTRYKYIFSREIGGDLGPGAQHNKLQKPLKYCGKVKSYNQVRGYGFIECGGYSDISGPQDIFFQKSDIQNLNSDPNLEIEENTLVCFDKDADPNGRPFAINVKIGCTDTNCIAMCT